MDTHLARIILKHATGMRCHRAVMTFPFSRPGRTYCVPKGDMCVQQTCYASMPIANSTVNDLRAQVVDVKDSGPACIACNLLLGRARAACRSILRGSAFRLTAPTAVFDGVEPSILVRRLLDLARAFPSAGLVA